MLSGRAGPAGLPAGRQPGTVDGHGPVAASAGPGVPPARPGRPARGYIRDWNLCQWPGTRMPVYWYTTGYHDTGMSVPVPRYEPSMHMSYWYHDVPVYHDTVTIMMLYQKRHGNAYTASGHIYHDTGTLLV